MNNRLLENIIIITLIGTLFCLIFPFVQKIIYQSDLDGVEASVYGNIDSVKYLYITESNEDEIDLPFTVKYNLNGYSVYVGSNLYAARNVIENHGRKPIGGEINISPAGLVTVTDLSFKNYICSMPPGGDLTCKRSS